MQGFGGRAQGFGGYPTIIYSAEELNMIAVRARLALETRRLQIQNHIIEAVGQLAYVLNDVNTLYRMLKFIGEQAVEVESIKLVNAKLSRIEELSVSIINSNGNLQACSSEFCYFQSVQWLRISKYIEQLKQFHKFCMDFFGRDITSDLNTSSLLFQKYPLLKYIKRQEILILNEVFGLIQPYLKINIHNETLEQVFKLNKQAINDKTRAPIAEGFINMQGQYGYTAFGSQGNIQNTANYQTSFQMNIPNNYQGAYNQNSGHNNFFNQYAQMNNYNNNISNVGSQNMGFSNYQPISNVRSQNMGCSNYQPQMGNTFNMPMDPSFPNYFANFNSNSQTEEMLKKQRELKQKKQKEEAERKAKLLQQQSILQKKLEQMKIKEENQRKIKEEQQRREREQSQRDRQFEVRRLARQREEKQHEVQINVFADNQREGPDREASGRFSNNFGTKVDFDQNEGEEFSFESPNQINNSLLRFSKEPGQKET